VLDRLIALLWRIGYWGYAVIFLGATLESAAFLGFLIPGETLVIVAGMLASLGILDPVDLIVVVAAGAILGDSVSYQLGHRLGHPWLVRYGRRVGLDHARLARVDAFYDRHGGVAVVFGRFVGFLRALVPFVAGAAHMSYPRFLCYNAFAAVLWSTSVVLFGYFVGGSWQIVERWTGRGGVVIAIASAVVGLLWLRRRHLMRTVAAPIAPPG
jgi:membrane protein DedA with SNARE-associated domain